MDEKSRPKAALPTDTPEGPSQNTKRILDGWTRRGWGDTFQAHLDAKHEWKTRGRYDALERRIARLERRWWA